MLTETKMQVPIARPYIGDEEKQAVMAVLDSGQLTQGAQVKAFEDAFAAYHGAEYAVAVSNGTTALIAALMAHQIGPGDEVIIPAFTFFATASSVLCVGAQPVFADIDSETMCLSPEATEAAITPRTKAIMPVHLFGHLADMPAFEAICRKHDLILLEDAAQAHGAWLDQHYAGTWGTAAFSFYPTKNMTTAEGGMVLTNDAEIDRRLRMIRHQGMNTQYYHEVLGYNFRLTNIAAAIGLAQLKRLPDWTEKRIAHAAFYNQRLEGLRLPVTQAGYRHVFHQYTVRVQDGQDRDTLVAQLNERGVGARVYYPLPIHQQPVIQEMNIYDGLELPETIRASQQVLSLPVHPLLSQEELNYVVQEVNALC